MNSKTIINNNNCTVNSNIQLPKNGKYCSKCNVFKPYLEYHKSSKSCDGLKSSCKLCRNELGKQYRSIHKDKRKEYHKKYYENKKERINAAHKVFAGSHKEKM